MKTFSSLCAFLLVLILIQLFCVYKNPDVSVARICTCLSAKEKKVCSFFSETFQDSGLRRAFYHSARQYGCTTSHRAAAAPKLTKTQNSPRGLLPPLTPVAILQNGGLTKPYGGTSPK